MVTRVTGWALNDELNLSLDVFARSRSKHAACLRSGLVYVLGGKDSNLPLNDFWSYDVGMLTWHSGTLRAVLVKCRYL